MGYSISDKCILYQAVGSRSGRTYLTMDIDYSDSKFTFTGTVEHRNYTMGASQSSWPFELALLLSPTSSLSQFSSVGSGSLRDAYRWDAFGADCDSLTSCPNTKYAMYDLDDYDDADALVGPQTAGMLNPVSKKDNLCSSGKVATLISSTGYEDKTESFNVTLSLDASHIDATKAYLYVNVYRRVTSTMSLGSGPLPNIVKQYLKDEYGSQTNYNAWGGWHLINQSGGDSDIPIDFDLAYICRWTGSEWKKEKIVMRYDGSSWKPI